MRHAKVLDERSTKKRNKKKTHATNCRIAQAYSMHADTIYNIKTNIDFTSAVGYILFDGGGARCTAFIQQEHDSFIHIFSSVNSIAAWMLCDVLRYMCHEWQTNNTNWVWTTGFFFLASRAKNIPFVHQNHRGSLVCSISIVTIEA